MKKILFIDKIDLEKTLLDGGEIISRRNYEIFKKLNYKIDLFSLKNYKNRCITFYNSLKKYSYGLNSNLEKKILKTLKNNQYDMVFLGSSNLGKLALEIRKIDSNIKIISFFHNAEIDFIQQYIKNKNKLYKILEKTVKYNEKMSIENSDFLIGLNKRDSNKIKEIYGREFDSILFTTFIDSFNNDDLKKNQLKENIEMLFVGSDFYGNIEGLDWFIKKCLPKIDKKLTVVGKGMEKYKEKYKEYNVEIIGTVPNISDYYYRSKVIVLPIKSGSGMKTKTCEALMYGRYIFGTEEAFQGYEFDEKLIGGKCNTEVEFIDSLKNFFKEEKDSFNEYSRGIFLKKYTTMALVEKLREEIKIIE